MGIRVAVGGASGYAGGEVLRLLLGHPQVEVGAVTAAGSAGSLLGAHHPQLVPLAGRTLEPTDAASLAGHDVVVLALPHGASAALVADLPDNVVVHRLRRRLPARGRLGLEPVLRRPVPPAAGPAVCPSWSMQAGASSATCSPARAGSPSRAAYPKAVFRPWPWRPGFAAGLLEPDDVVVVAASGTSGAGRALKPHLLGSEVHGLHDAVRRGRGARHTPEVEQYLAVAGGGPVSLSFTPTLAPMARGILATATARIRPGVDEVRLRAEWAAAYDDEPVRAPAPGGQWPRTVDTLGANVVHLQLALDPRAGRVVVVAAIDNLTKGTAGAAVQSLNLALGIPETLGLPVVGLARECHRPQGLPGGRRRGRAEVERRPDVALVVNDGPGSAAAAVYTTNRCKAHPVIWSEQASADGVVRAVVLNSGGANCYTGPDGFATTHGTAEQVADLLGISANRRGRLLHRADR